MALRSSVKYPGVILGSRLSCDEHLDYAKKNIASVLQMRTTIDKNWELISAPTES